MRPVTWAPFGITVFPSTRIGVVRLAAKVSPTLFLSVASVWPTAALIAVPFGTVTIVVGSAALAAAAGFAATAGFAAAAGFAVSASFALLVASSVADTASQRFRCTRESNISH